MDKIAREAEIFCVITYPSNTVAASRMIGGAYGFEDNRGKLISAIGDPVSKSTVYTVVPDKWETGHGCVIFGSNKIIIRDCDRMGRNGETFIEYVLTPALCPVIYLESHITEFGEYAAVFYAGKDDRLMLCAIRAINTDDARLFRKGIRGFLTANRYKFIGGGVYEKAEQ